MSLFVIKPRIKPGKKPSPPTEMASVTFIVFLGNCEERLKRQAWSLVEINTFHTIETRSCSIVLSIGNEWKTNPVVATTGLIWQASEKNSRRI